MLLLGGELGNVYFFVIPVFYRRGWYGGAIKGETFNSSGPAIGLSRFSLLGYLFVCKVGLPQAGIGFFCYDSTRLAGFFSRHFCKDTTIKTVRSRDNYSIVGPIDILGVRRPGLVSYLRSILSTTRNRLIIRVNGVQGMASEYLGGCHCHYAIFCVTNGLGVMGVSVLVILYVYGE